MYVIDVEKGWDAVNAEIEPTEPPGELATPDTALAESTRQRILDGFAANTRRAYTRQWLRFEEFCVAARRRPMPATAETLAEYTRHLVDLGHGPPSIEQALAVVRSAHSNAGHDAQPNTRAARMVLRSYRRELAEEGGHRERKATPIDVEALRTMVEHTPDTLTGLRDRVILVLGFSLMARRSELAGLHLDDLTDTHEGLVVLIRMSKTDQEAVGEEVALPYGQHPNTCPVRVSRAWRDALAELGITTGRLLRGIDRHGHVGTRMSGKAINDVVRALARRAGLANPEGYRAHSLRAGGATEAYRTGAPMNVIAQHGRWNPKSPVVNTYIRSVDRWRNNPMKGIGL